MRMTAAVGLSVVLAGCAPKSPPAPTVACGAPGYPSLVGRRVAAVTLPSGLEMRIIQPGDAVTQDFRAARMNLVVDDQGVITRIYCG